MTRWKTAETPAALIAMLAIAAVCWIIALRQMEGMDMGVATELGSFAFFLAVWISMMAAMMLPGAVPGAWRASRSSGDAAVALVFGGSYLAVWTTIGLLAYLLYRPHSTSVAGALVVAAGLYELTPLKRTCRLRCRGSVRSSFGFGFYCLGSSRA